MTEYYTFWTDSYGKNIEISKMDDFYINNCIKRIVDAIELYINRNCSSQGNCDTSDVFSKPWTLEYGENYLMSFNAELEIRTRIKNKDYPSINLPEICMNCSNICCTHTTSNYSRCNEWNPNPIKIIDCLNGDYISQQVANREACYINGKLYTVK